MRAPLILILGMHRSGTSLLASVLQCLGAALPGILIPADQHNPEGYFEWGELVALQERLLIDLGRWWPSAEGCLPMPPGWMQQIAAVKAQHQLLELISRHLQGQQETCWVIKDPRTSRLLPLWLNVAEALQIPLRLLLAIRDPAEVVCSLVRRDGPVTGMNAKQAQQLWWRFNLEPIHGAPADQALHRIDYGAWFSQPERQLERLLTAIPELHPDDDQRRQALSMIRPQHRRSLPSRQRPIRLHRKVIALYQDLVQDDTIIWPSETPPRSLRSSSMHLPHPGWLALQLTSWPLWLHRWRHYPAARFAGIGLLAPAARIRLQGMNFKDHKAHLWLQRLPLDAMERTRISSTSDDCIDLHLSDAETPSSEPGLTRITINLTLPRPRKGWYWFRQLRRKHASRDPDPARDWLRQLQQEQVIWDPDPARVRLLRALGLQAYWLDPMGTPNGWLSQPAAIDPECWGAELGFAPPTAGAYIVLGEAGPEWNRALTQESRTRSQQRSTCNPSPPPSIDYRPGWNGLIQASPASAQAKAGWLMAASRLASALVWLDTDLSDHQRLLADGTARLIQEQPPLTPVQLRARLMPKPEKARAEDRPSPAITSLFSWQSGRTAKAAVIVTLFNYRDRILTALESVATQSQNDLELIVVDDRSSDGGAELVQAWMQCKCPSLRDRFARIELIVHNQNAGLATARNTAFTHSTASWCFVLDADNLLFPEALSVCLSLTDQASPALAVVHPLLAVEAEESVIHDQRTLVATGSWQRPILAEGNVVDAMALVRRSAWEAAGGYTHIEGGWEDFDLWCKFIDLGYHGIQCPQILALYRSHANSMSSTHTNGIWRALSLTLTERHPWLRLRTLIHPGSDF